MSSFARQVKREKLKNAIKKNKEQFKRANPGKKFIDIKFNKFWAKYQEKIKKNK